MLAEQVNTRRDGLVSQATWLLNLTEGPRFAMLLYFFSASAGRQRLVDLDAVILWVDPSGSMVRSVVYVAIVVVVMASLPVVPATPVCFDTAIVDLIEDRLADVAALGIPCSPARPISFPT